MKDLRERRRIADLLSLYEVADEFQWATTDDSYGVVESLLIALKTERLGRAVAVATLESGKKENRLLQDEIRALKLAGSAEGAKVGARFLELSNAFKVINEALNPPIEDEDGS